MSGSVRKSLLRDGRLKTVYELLGETELVVDVGCDHGYLAAELVLSGKTGRAVASDVSRASVKKAAGLAERLGISGRMTVLEADGLSSAINADAPYRIAVSGMGGELIAKLVERNRKEAEKAELIVMQPMRGEAELRRYLFENGFGIVDDRVVLDGGRFYQIIAAKYGVENSVPDGFPKGYYRFGWVAADRHPGELLPLLMHYRSVYLKELEKAKAKGNNPEGILKEIELTDAVIRFAEETGKCC